MLQHSCWRPCQNQWFTPWMPACDLLRRPSEKRTPSMPGTPVLLLRPRRSRSWPKSLIQVRPVYTADKLNCQKVRTKTSHRGQKANCHFQTVFLFRYLHQSSLKSKVQMRFFFFSDYRVTCDFMLCLALSFGVADDLNKQVCLSVHRGSTVSFMINMQRTWFTIITF